MRVRIGIVGLAAVTALAVVAAAFAAPAARTKPIRVADGISCKDAKIALIAPLSGDAGFLGTEQLQWSKLAVALLNKQNHTKYKFLAGDSQLDPALASTLAQKYVSDPTVLGIVGPSTSGAVVATGPILKDASLAAVSPSATRISLTDGSNPTFFRDVPHDGIQGPSDADYMVDKLKAKKVYIIDDQETYSTGLADAVQKQLGNRGISFTRDSVSQSVTDFSSIVTKIPADTDVVFVPWQQPPRAQTFAEQMAEQGKKAKVFGSDGTNSPGQFKFKGSYVSNFAPDITGIPEDKDIIAAFKKANPAAKVGSFGPPSYGAVQILFNAINTACAKGKGTATRQAVLKALFKTKITPWILGGTFSFNYNHDPVGAKFYIFQIQGDGSYKLVG